MLFKNHWSVYKEVKHCLTLLDRTFSIHTSSALAVRFTVIQFGLISGDESFCHANRHLEMLKDVFLNSDLLLEALA